MGLKTGIYSGSFNPIHIGHLALANWLCEFEGLDEVWFVVTPHNPLKKKDDLLDDSLRLEMAQAAIDGYPKFRVCDIEFYLPKPSYSIDTLRTLSRNYPNRDFYFIMGEELTLGLHLKNRFYGCYIEYIQNGDNRNFQSFHFNYRFEVKAIVSRRSIKPIGHR